MPWAAQLYKQSKEGRHTPKQCKVCRFNENIRRFIEDSYEEKMTGSKIAGMLREKPYNVKVSHGCVNRHCREHLFLRHIEEEEITEFGGSVEAAQILNDFTKRKSILWTGPYAVPTELLELTFDPVKRLQELFFIQYARFIKMLNRENAEEVSYKETRQLGTELREILVQLTKLVESASDSPAVKEEAVIGMLIKSFDNVSIPNRAELVNALLNADKIEELQ